MSFFFSLLGSTPPRWLSYCWCWSCCGFVGSANNHNHEQEIKNFELWQKTVRHVLETTSSCQALGIAQHVRQGLLLDDEDGDNDDGTFDFMVENYDLLYDEQDQQQFVWKGLPRHPLYKVLAFRLYRLHKREAHKQDKKSNNKLVIDIENGNDCYTPLLIPAKKFGLSEDEGSSSPVPWRSPALSTTQLNAKAIRQWFCQAGNRGVLKMLGLRHTVGSDPRGLLPPSWSALLQAANRPIRPNATLSVAGRARAKHAHRGSTKQFFGTPKGCQDEQNAAAHDIVVQMLQNAAWINIHTFSSGTTALEVRVASGYGARWVADWTTDPARPTGIEFRGFLEPQMENGHALKWKHA